MRQYYNLQIRREFDISKRSPHPEPFSNRVEAKRKSVYPRRQSVPFLHMEHPERCETRSLSGVFIFIKMQVADNKALYYQSLYRTHIKLIITSADRSFPASEIFLLFLFDFLSHSSLMSQCPGQLYHDIFLVTFLLKAG